jgi:cation diffusion facilitator family transporter
MARGRSGLLSRLREAVTPHSHHHTETVDSALETTAQGIRATRVSLVGLLITAALQVIIVAFSGSVALLADTVHNFSDALTSVPLWIAFVVGRRTVTRSYTYGYRRAEDLAGLFIVAMIALSAGVAGWESVQRLIEPEPVRNVAWVIAAGVVGFIGNEAVAVYRIRIGRRIASAALIADGQHARTDGFTSLGVVASGVAVAVGFPRADPIIGLLITVAILFVLRDAGRQVFRRLMDGVDPSLVTMTERVAKAVDGVRAVTDVRLRWVGHRLDANVTIAVDADLTVAQGHGIGEHVRHQLHHELRGLDRAIVHVDPRDGDQHDFHALTRHHEGDAADPGRPSS